MLDAAVAAALPERIVPPHLPPPPKGRTIVLGAGKASAAMAKAVEDHWPGPLEGLVVTRYGHAVPCERIEIVEAAHPVPDAAGRAAAERILQLAQGAGPDDLVLCLISGGGSALLALPAEGLTLEDKQAVNKALLASGADIGQMNVVRRAPLGDQGRPARRRRAPGEGGEPLDLGRAGRRPDGDRLRPDRCRPHDLRRRARHPRPLRHRAAGGGAAATSSAAAEETPKPGDPRLAAAETVIVAKPQASLEAAAEVAREAGVTPLILGDSLEGEAREVGRVMAGMALQVRQHGQPVPAPCVLLSGGETTVTVRGKGGRGGRNTEFLLGFALQLRGLEGVWAIAGDTDGIDGSEDNAGAIVTPDTLERARALRPEPGRAPGQQRRLRALRSLGDLVATGPTLTNVNDFRAVLVTG